MAEEKLVFSPIKEVREKYFIEYFPPHHGSRFATISLVYTNKVEPTQVAKDVENEGRLWLQTYPVPVMVSAFDATGGLIYLDEVRPESHFICFYDSDSCSIKEYWELLRDDAIPEQALNPEYLLAVYAGIKWRRLSTIKVEAIHKSQRLKLGARIIFLWLAVVPAILLIVEHFAPQWLAELVLLFSLSMALIKGLKMTGKIRKSKAELAREKELLDMRHHHYHCTINPEGFLRLKLENFDRMATESIKNEAKTIKSSL